MNLTVNQLPSRTFRRLGMNEARLTLEEPLESLIPGAEYPEKDLQWEEKSDFSLCELQNDLASVTGSADQCLAEVRSGVRMETPLVLTYHYEKGARAASRLALHAGQDSCLKAVLVLTGDGAVSALSAEVYAEEGASVELYVVQLLGENTLVLKNISGVTCRNARIDLTALELGGSRVYAGTYLDLQGSDSRFSSQIGYHCKAAQTLDMNYAAVHGGRRTESAMEVNGTLEEGAKKIFRGTIDFRQGCAGAKAGEKENVMLMGDDLVNQTIPVILCKEEDVEGNHGASIGQLDDKVLFYLGSRGISREAAQQMIAQARIDAICEKIPVSAVLQQVREFESVRGISHGEKH